MLLSLVAALANERGAIQADDAPTQDSTTPTATSVVSLWQTGSIGFKGVLRASWKIGRPGPIAVLQGGGADWLA